MAVRPVRARAGFPASALRFGKKSTQTGAVTEVEAPGDAVGAQCSRVEGAGDAEAAPDPASGGGGAA
jgi:hypothetical protein